MQDGAAAVARGGSMSTAMGVPVAVGQRHLVRVGVRVGIEAG